MTTHSTHISEASEIQRVNVIKSCGNHSIVMCPTNGLDIFGKNHLSLGTLSLSECIERYLDAKRSVLLFSKGVILVEGDGEEILLPAMVKNALGISLDELGIGLINVGSTAFEYIACLFDDYRLQRHCAIITDRDIQAVTASSSYYKAEADAKGKTRQDKLKKLFKENPWVEAFYAPNTFEIEFAKETYNHVFIDSIIELRYSQEAAIVRHKAAIKTGGSIQAESTLLLANDLGKGWFATLLASHVGSSVSIPDYILQAIAFASQDVLDSNVKHKMVSYSANEYLGEEAKTFYKELAEITDNEAAIDSFCRKYPNDVVSRFIGFCK